MRAIDIAQGLNCKLPEATTPLLGIIYGECPSDYNIPFQKPAECKGNHTLRGVCKSCWNQEVK